MIKNIKLSTITAIAVFSVIGCGSSSSSDVKTGTGYYVDNAVQGVDYACGSKTGKTDSKGTFTFEKGKECKFTLAGIPLRTTPSDELTDGKEVFEDNPKVAQFLQSIDSDNNLTNGIQITDEVLTALTTALATSQSTGTLPEGTVLTEVVASVGHDVTAVTGDVRTDVQVQEHLAQTQTEITKALLAGKTFYVVGDNGDDKNKVDFFKIIVNKEATSLKSYNLDGTFDDDANIKIIGNKMIFANDTDGSYSLISQENKYVLSDDRNANGAKTGTIGHRLYASQSDAQAYFDSVKGEVAQTQTEITKALFAGKTLYVAYNENGTNTIEKLIFNNDVSSMIWEIILGNKDAGTESVQIDGNKMIVGDKTPKIILNSTDKYIEVDNQDGDDDSLLYSYLSTQPLKEKT
jgi:hypothetical protein